MARSLSDILRRFRPAVAPGPAGPAGVPADRVAETEVELAGVFAALESTVGEARLIREEGRADAERARRSGAGEAARILADARARRDAVRAEAAAAHLAELDAERAAIDQAARAEAERVRRAGEDRLPSVVAEAVAAVWSSAGLPPGAPPAAERGEVAG